MAYAFSAASGLTTWVSGGAAATTTPASASFTPNAGELGILIVGNNGNTAETISSITSGWTQMTIAGTAGNRVQVFINPNLSSGAQTVGYTSTVSQIRRWYLGVFTGHDNTLAATAIADIINRAVSSNGSTAFATSAGANNSDVDELAISFVGGSGTGIRSVSSHSALNPASGWSSNFVNAPTKDAQLFLAHILDVASSGITVTNTWTLSGSLAGDGVVVLLKPTAGGGGGNNYTGNLTLGTTVSHTRDASLAMSPSLTLTATPSAGPANALTIAQSLALAANVLATTNAGFIVPGSVTLGAVQAAMSPSVVRTLSPTVALTVAASSSPTALLAMVQTLSLAAVLAETQAAGFSYSGTVGLNAAAVTTPTSQKTLAGAIALQAAALLTPSSFVTILGSLTMTARPSLSPGGTLVLQASAALATKAQLDVFPGGQNYTGLIALTTTAALTRTIQVVLGGTVTLTTIDRLTPTAQQQLATQIALQIRQDLAAASAAVMGVTTTLAASVNVAPTAGRVVTAGLTLSAAAQLVSAFSYLSGGGAKVIQLIAEALQSAALTDLGLASPTLTAETLVVPSITNETVDPDA